ncbi:RNA polymerase sigma-70 factor [Desertivirga arenae]|uniref:RNA polymerase sigma-70 factor n=1 Tax=Desertivirga arenae TaxID=2810309 RepID=UPI001A975139|nr:RNA polymerase sigma-70 factor [Pedobacter sp. SYSU D00823]
MEEAQAKYDRLIQAIATEKDELAYKELYQLLYPGVKRFAISYLRDYEQAEELGDDVMISLWRNKNKLSNIRNIKVYVLVLARHRCLDLLRVKKNRFEQLEDIHIDLQHDENSPENIVLTNELKAKITSAINSLPPQCKLVFHLIREEQLSYKEAAEVLSISVKTVDAHLVSAMKKIGFFLKKEYDH